MEYIYLGKSTLRVSTISFGCMSLPPGDAGSAQLIDRAIGQGINFFDTADLYDKGANEQLLGQLLKSRRKELVIATKVGNQWNADGKSWSWNPRKAYILSSVEGSLQRLQTDYIDLYQLHGGTMDDSIDETIEAFELLRSQGKIRYYGISSIRPNVIREYVRRSNIVSVMMQYSLLDRRPEESCFPLLQEHQIGVLARGTVARGLLAGKPAADYLGYTAADVAKAAAAVRLLSAGKRSTAQTALKFVLQHPAVTSAVMGIRTATQLDDILQCSAASPLSEEERKMLRSAVQPNRYTEHR